MSDDINMPGELEPVVQAYFVTEQRAEKSGRLTITLESGGVAVRARDFAELIIKTVRCLNACVDSLSEDEKRNSKSFDWAIVEACVIDNKATFTLLDANKKHFKKSNVST